MTFSARSVLRFQRKVDLNSIRSLSPLLINALIHSARAAEEGANCRIRPNEKLQFKESRTSDLSEAKPGTRVKYRYTEDSEKGSEWELQKVSSS